MSLARCTVIAILGDQYGQQVDANRNNPYFIAGRYFGRGTAASVAAAELGLAVFGAGSGTAISLSGIGTAIGVPEIATSVVIGAHGAAVLTNVGIRTAVDPLPNIYFAQASSGGGNSTPIYGEPQHDTSPEHNAKVQGIANDLAQSGDYDGVWIDNRISNSTGGIINIQNEPDVLALNFKKMKAYIAEVMSPTQLPGKADNGLLVMRVRIMAQAFQKGGWTAEYIIVPP